MDFSKHRFQHNWRNRPSVELPHTAQSQRIPLRNILLFGHEFIKFDTFFQHNDHCQWYSTWAPSSVALSLKSMRGPPKLCWWRTWLCVRDKRTCCCRRRLHRSYNDMCFCSDWSGLLHEEVTQWPESCTPFRKIVNLTKLYTNNYL